MNIDNGLSLSSPATDLGQHGAQASASRARGFIAIAADLTKARLVSLVLVTTAVGFLLAANRPTSRWLLFVTLIGTGLTASGSMALNELWERRRDARMQRTRHRPLPAGEISPAAALAIGVGCVTAGFVVLAGFANLLTALLGLGVVAIYVLLYTPLKARSTACTLVGAVCGAIPPMMGWSAASGDLGFGAWLLAALLFLWQIPHFLALAWLYRDDYRRGGFKVLPVLDPTGRSTTTLANLYILPLLPIGAAAALAGMTGWQAAAGALLLACGLLAAGLHLAASRTDRSARRLFLATLVYLPLTLALLVADRPVQPRSVAASAGAGQRAALPAADLVVDSAPLPTRQ